MMNNGRAMRRCPGCGARTRAKASADIVDLRTSHESISQVCLIKDNNIADCAAAGAPGLNGAIKQVAVSASLRTGVPEAVQHSVYWSIRGLFLDYLWLCCRSGCSGGIFPVSFLLIRQFQRGRFCFQGTLAPGLSVVLAVSITLASHVIPSTRQSAVPQLT
jgi:hypothetical protein